MNSKSFYRENITFIYILHITRTSGRSAPLVLVPVPHTQMLVPTPDVSHNP